MPPRSAPNRHSWPLFRPSWRPFASDGRGCVPRGGHSCQLGGRVAHSPDWLHRFSTHGRHSNPRGGHSRQMGGRTSRMAAICVSWAAGRARSPDWLHRFSTHGRHSNLRGGRSRQMGESVSLVAAIHVRWAAGRPGWRPFVSDGRPGGAFSGLAPSILHTWPPLHPSWRPFASDGRPDVPDGGHSCQMGGRTSRVAAIRVRWAAGWARSPAWLHRFSTDGRYSDPRGGQLPQHE
ncbi:hypothetical protein J2X01_002777 [Arthrobacter ginsengisoli]|uniref:Uncharacterized protein n=1 Tax=Arthrobacter ginsengisoli TaxID=1356565 RepID=A0ABU1UEA8_9MICC|nr:hypothetical protein [Arthrobacter ginsengisoli]